MLRTGSYFPSVCCPIRGRGGTPLHYKTAAKTPSSKCTSDRPSATPLAMDSCGSSTHTGRKKHQSDHVGPAPINNKNAGVAQHPRDNKSAIRQVLLYRMASESCSSMPARSLCRLTSNFDYIALIGVVIVMIAGAPQYHQHNVMSRRECLEVENRNS